MSIMLRVYKTSDGVTVEEAGRFLRSAGLSIDALFKSEHPLDTLAQFNAQPAEAPNTADLLPPIESQEVWAAGVTYLRSRDARIEESESSGADRLYDMVYEAARPELFFKATPSRVRGHGQTVRIRSDGTWNVPEPELTLAINRAGRIFGYTIGNDMSSRDIEGENPLYLPQAKIYRGSCALGPALVLAPEPLPPTTRIEIEILRGDVPVFTGESTLSRMKRGLDELASWLFREQDFPEGAYLMTGTGIVPPATFSLRSRDLIRISIEGLGRLENEVE
ncbi:MAG: fumarylacetoacetate hydrolase family protein [Verrucomicrobiales bacterium]